ncbi:MAG: VirD4-like conjugal transfer protein, CD1115 family [Clostridia bacterium]
MNYKLQKAFKKGKTTIIVSVILWLLLAVIVIMPWTCGCYQMKLLGKFDMDQFLRVYMKTTTSPSTGFKAIFSSGIFGEYIKNLFGFTLFYTIFVAIGIIRLMPKHQYDDIEHGSSDWSENGEQYKVLSKKSGIILAENNYLPLDKRGNVNVLVVGGSGSGKSASYSIPNAHQMLGSYVFTDPKGELYDRTAGYLREHGYKIKVLNLVHPQYSDGYNPLLHISSEIDVDVIANTIVKGQKSEGGGSDPFWDDSAETLLKSLIYYLMATRPEEEQNLASCAEMVRAANSNGGSNLLTELMSQLPYDHPARMNYKSIEIAPEKTYSSILSTLQSKLGKFDSKEIAELTSTDTINFEEIGSEKTAVYVISSDTHGAYDFLLTIFFAQMIQQLYDFADNNGGKLKERTYFILDEFANIGRIPDFDKKISTSRSRGISFSVILQNLDQLEAIYEKANETIIGNCDTHVFLGSNSQKTVEYFSKALGEKTISHESISTNRDKEHKKTGTSDSDQIMARALMTPDELRRMDNDLCIIFEKGVKPVKANKFYYFKKPMAKEMAALEISHNDIGEIERGKWRKYNPYNPYVEEKDKEPVKDLKVESLDDLFDDPDPIEEPKKESKPKQEDKKIEKLSLEDIDNDDAPMLPMNEDPEDEYDLQKELEAKFDELFGPIDDDN